MGFILGRLGVQSPVTASARQSLESASIVAGGVEGLGSECPVDAKQKSENAQGKTEAAHVCKR